MQSFSVHGLSRICTGTRSESMFWTCVVLIGVTLSSYVIYELISKYFKYEVYTSVRNHVTNENAFPSITFCDFNLMKKNYFTYCGVDIFVENPDAHKPCNHTVLTPPPEIKNILHSKRHDWSNGLFHVRTCSTWGGVSCATDRYLKSKRLLNNTCFTLNWQGDLHDTYSHAIIEFEMNLTSGMDYSFIMATVQHHLVSEIDMQHTTFIEPSKTYQLMIKKTEVIRLPYPFPSNCSSGKDADIFPGKYTRTTCIESLNYIDMLKKCGDTLDYVRQHIPQNIIKTYRRINQSISDTLMCMRTYSMRKVGFNEMCPVPCQEVELYTTSTFHELHKLKRKIYRVHIQLQDIDSYKVIEEKQLFTWDQIAGQVGGFLGLVVGASFISIIEIIAYLCLCLLQRCFNTLY